MALICGVDEAGRGPMMGPMVMCGFVIDEEDIGRLQDLGVKDSKKLTAKQREALFDDVIKLAVKYEIVIVSAKEIDEAVESETSNLNWLEAIKTSMILNKLQPEKAIVDSPSNNKQAYGDFLKTYLKDKELQLQLEHNAERFLPVAAASILAKVTRDREIEKLKVKYGDFGSGYPSDPKTKDYLKENWKKHPEIFRKTWASYKKVAVNQKNLGCF
ncbi:MAG: ribonuclease HII [Nanoarchaeota archaeon]|nr:ribonuclease HII [Nanoarchaeota archaeon]MBU4242484.1 ribonuclease HII [Nanoarchaeota archaeon]MBU4351454.1 ribonuclease HII [Nanoarchaeota archaeon]MBU4456388.1 ribonuclease HII [Nanoarchaeota archaeon]MCG2720159.1 ribonuclease HII [Nanoarchaeota archaeon]